MKYNFILLSFSCFVNPGPTIKKYLGPRILKQQQQKKTVPVQQWKMLQDNDPLYQLHQMFQNIEFPKYFVKQVFL